MVAVVDFTNSKIQTGTSTGTTLAHTCSGSDRMLHVVVAFDSVGGGAPVVSGITYDGVAMTLVDDVGGGGAGRRLFLYQIAAPATGNNNIVVSWGSTSVQAWVASISTTGVASRTGYIAQAANSTANISIASIPSSSSDLLLGFTYLNNLTIGDVTEGASQTLEEDESGGGVLWISSKLGTTASESMSWTNPSQSYGSIALSLAPASTVSITPTDTTPDDASLQTITASGMTGPITAASIGGLDILKPKQHRP